MIDQLTSEGLLQFSKPQLYFPVLKRIHEGRPNDHAKAPTSVEEAGERQINWSDGFLTDTNSLAYNAMSFIATRRLRHVRTPGQWKMASGTDVETTKLQETIHPSVFHRMQHSKLAYEPEGLSEKEWRHRARSHGSGYEWVRTLNGKEVAVIPEYEFLKIDKQEFEKKDLWSGSLEAYLAPKDVLGSELYEKLKTDLLQQMNVLQADL